MRDEDFGGTRRPEDEIEVLSTAFDAVCPYCGTVQEVHTSFAGATPKENDIMICMSCLNVGCYGADLQLVKPSDELLEKIMADDYVQKVLFALRTVKRRNESSNN
jgi:hypothetical protein